MSNIYFVGGCKGGTGKSMLANGLLHYLLEKNKQVALVETDTSNPDVAYAYAKEIPVRNLDLDKKEGWLDLITFCDEHAGKDIVINTGARNEAGMKAFHKIFSDSMKQQHFNIVMFWVINANLDSVNLVRNFMDIMPEAKLHIVKSGVFGNEDDFEIYEGSEAKKMIEAAGGQSGYMYKLANRVVTRFYNQSESIGAMKKTMTIGDRAELFQFTNGLELMFDGMIGSK